MTIHIEGIFEVAINERPYRVVQELHTRRFLDVIRQQADAANEPSERSLNPNDLWRRSQDDWVFGSGQSIYDDDESTRKRYNSSTSVTPWVKGELSLLNTTSRIDSLTGEIGKAVKAQGKLWVMNDTVLAIWDGATWSASAATPQKIRDVATDGTNIYLAVRNDAKSVGSVYIITNGSTTPVVLNNVIPDKVAYVRGRLMVAAGPTLYNILDAGDPTPPDPITAPAINENWEWDGFGAGQSYIYAAGHSDELSLVYRITIREDGTALTAPVVAAQMPDLEFVYSIVSYMQTILLGTSKGLRVGVINGGSLQYGALIETSTPVKAIEPEGNFIWAGDDGSLVRADLTRFIPTLELTPAYAPDLISGVAGSVEAVVTWDNSRLLVVHNQGVFQENLGEYETSGELTTGKFTYGLPDRKQFQFLDIRTTLSGSETVEVLVAYDGGVFTSVETLTASEPSQSLVLDSSAEEAEVKLVLTGDSTSTPVVNRLTLRALPAPSRTEQITIGLDLRESLLALNGSSKDLDVWEEFELLQGLARTGESVDYQEFGKNYIGSLENVQLGPELDVNERSTSWEGICVVTLRIYQ